VADDNSPNGHKSGRRSYAITEYRPFSSAERATVF
jgi:hypothetical protein